ncbi:phage antirepressor N-terminal domain-containing protein [Neisseria lisongii]|uniref:Phage antirepressor N-terminal domain-containing protein n=1 Tax=Neisseria lisongii TaxID=2912188 RepID=A0AAW5ARB7_9NEIS|nr:phage antirepressor N-terminal domain-containing protein [Neisseria lisongii]MCF7528667.1 phage antirepressor N-terminal domain-containing protein [Neisseria lisongii]MCF7529525.1 phage antirepressor N-terminal domain-containing protein [Neisseria lisongii]
MNTLITIPFYDRPLNLIDADGRPFVAMRPIVDGMGLNWKSQQAKLQNRFNSTVAIIATVAQDGKQREMLCLPLEKLPEWLMTVNPRKVKPETRSAIERYQAESGEALWQYWTTGTAKREAIRQALAEREAEESESFQRGSRAGKSLYTRKLEKQRNQAVIAALQAQLPFIWEAA